MDPLSDTLSDSDWERKIDAILSPLHGVLLEHSFTPVTDGETKKKKNKKKKSGRRGHRGNGSAVPKVSPEERIHPLSPEEDSLGKESNEDVGQWHLVERKLPS